jgi:iron-sulfur cluster repair protein YtfE (RIC family)
MQSSFKQIVEEIVARHHSLLRRELPRVTEFMEALSIECSGRESLSEARQIYAKVRTKIETHLKDEETVLFPTGICLESGGTLPPTEMDLVARLEEMEKEHDGCGKALGTVCEMINTVEQSRLRDQLLDAIQIVQDDLRIHVEKENAQVHPRFIQLLEARASVEQNKAVPSG